MGKRDGGGKWYEEGVCPTIHKDYREMLFTRLSTGPLADSTTYNLQILQWGERWRRFCNCDSSLYTAY